MANPATSGHLDDLKDHGDYLDVNWDLNIILDANSEVLLSFDFHDNAGHSVAQSMNLPTGSPVNQQLNKQYLQHQPQHQQHQPQQPQAQNTTEAPKSTKPRRPCDHCRRRKTKCVIIPGTNNCAQCESKSITCTYNLPPRRDDDEPSSKRSRKAAADQDHMRVLGVDLALQNQGPTPDQYSRGVNGYGNIMPPNVTIRDVQPVQDYSSMNHSLLKRTLSLQFPRLSFYIGPTSYLFDNNLLDVILGQKNPEGDEGGNGARRANRVEQVNLSDTVSLRRVGEKTQFILKDDQSPNTYQNMSNDVDAIEKFVAPHGQILIDLYFRIIHPSYPILHKKVFLEKYSRTHREFSAPLLAAVYALAIQWWDYDPQLNRFAKPNVDMMLKIALNNFMLEILKRPKLSAVQAGLLLLQCKHIFRESHGGLRSNDPVANASATITSSFSDSDFNEWVLCSQVVAIAEELGLALDCDKWKLPKWERGLRKRLAWAVFMEDKWLSLKNSRPSHISEDNWAVLELREEDFPEKAGDGDLKEGSSDITIGKKNFMNLVNLSQVLSGILKSLYSMKALKETVDIDKVLQIAKPIQLELRTWYHSLPIELQMTSVQPRKLCPNGYLQLSYFATELTLHRKIITTIHQMSGANKPVPKELVGVCRAAAKTRLLASIEFVRDLKPEHIHSFWHSSSSANFTLIGTFAAILFVSATTKEEADFYKDQIFNYRWILKISSKGFIQVGDALDQLDLVIKHIPGLLSDTDELPGMTPQAPAMDYNKLYEQQMRNPTRPADNSQYGDSPSSQATSVDGGRNGSQLMPRPRQQAPTRFSASNQQFQKSGRQDSNYGGGGMTRPSPSQQHRGQPMAVVASPYDSPQAFNTPGFSTNNSISRGSQINNSPQQSQGISPKDALQRLSVAINSPDTNGGGSVGRRPSSNSHASEAQSQNDGAHSSKTNSPAVMRSPVQTRK